MSLTPRRATLALLLLATATLAAHAETAVDRPAVDLTKLLNTKPGLVAEDITINDPVYKKTMNYRGYRLDAVLRRAYKDIDKIAAEGAELVLRAADGYAPSMDLKKALDGKGIVAFRDLAQPATDPWESFLHGKERITPAPYYLVWPGVRPDDPAYKWPYQLVEIEIQSFAKRFGEAVPKPAAGADARDGFALFREHCISCHSINLVGGNLAPELNVPKNVTEYWRADDIKALIRDASTYRARAKMPPFTFLSGAQMDDLLAYLTAMKAQKICDAQRPCPN